MGVCKGPVYNAVRDAMTTVLTDVYRNVYNFKPNFVSKIMTIFGSDYGGIDMGMYAHIAKLLEQANQLDLFDKVKKMNFSTEADELAFVLGKLRSVPGMSSACIDFFVEQYKTYELSAIMSRMEKFRAGCRLQYIAAQMPDTLSYYTLPSYIKSMIKRISSALGKTPKQVFDSLKRIKKARERFSLLSDLATVYNQAGGGETGVAAVEKEKKKLNKLKSLLVDSSLAIDMVKNTAEKHERLGNLGGMMNKLASTYNNASSEEEGLAAINKDPKLDELALLFPGGKQAALEAVLNTANSCSKSFWENFKKLKKYRKDFPGDVVEVEVNGDMVKVLTIDTSRNSESHSLHQWLVTQNGHRYAKGETEDNWGFKAYKRMGSIEQLALSGIDVTFDTENEVHQKAMDKRLGNKATESVDEEVGDFITFLGGN